MPELTHQPFDRVAVIGTSSVGKTRFAGELARRLGVAQVELDELFWQPDWTPSQEPEFRARVRDALAAQPRWVCDGNYCPVLDLRSPDAVARGLANAAHHSAPHGASASASASAQ